MAAAVLRMRTCVIVLVWLLTTIPVACATSQTITLRLGAPTALALERPFKTVLIGDPNIVDVHALNDRRITLEPLNLGTTNLIFVDDRSIAITNLRIVVLGPGDRNESLISADSRGLPVHGVCTRRSKKIQRQPT